jgi:hypothetical protein
MKRSIQVGDTVAFHGEFLRNTGQFTGPDAHARWKVLVVDGEFLVLDEPRDPFETFTHEEFDTFEPDVQFAVSHRRVHRGNVYVVGRLDMRNA